MTREDQAPGGGRISTVVVKFIKIVYRSLIGLAGDVVTLEAMRMQAKAASDGTTSGGSTPPPPASLAILCSTNHPQNHPHTGLQHSWLLPHIPVTTWGGGGGVGSCGKDSNGYKMGCSVKKI